jgi:hypothetical protein
VRVWRPLRRWRRRRVPCYRFTTRVWRGCSPRQDRPWMSRACPRCPLLATLCTGCLTLLTYRWRRQRAASAPQRQRFYDDAVMRMRCHRAPAAPSLLAPLCSLCMHIMASRRRWLCCGYCTRRCLSGTSAVRGSLSTPFVLGCICQVGYDGETPHACDRYPSDAPRGVHGCRSHARR